MSWLWINRVSTWIFITGMQTGKGSISAKSPEHRESDVERLKTL